MKFKFLLLSLLCAALWQSNPLLADDIDIREWLVPWKKSVPLDPHVDNGGYVWFVGQSGNYIGSFRPENGLFNRYDLPPGTEPHNLIVDEDRNIWFTGKQKRRIGRLSPSTGQTTQIEISHQKANDLHTLVFDASGNIWFTVQKGNFIGKLTISNESVELIEIPTRKFRPQSVIVDRDNMPWAAAAGSNKILQIFPSDMTLQEIDLPDKKSRPRRLASTSNGDIWYTDFAQGRLGRYRPGNEEFSEWSVPGGDDSEPFGIAVDRNDRIWFVETGSKPNRFIGFDAKSEVFLDGTDIPSGGGSVRHMYYYEAAGEVWFATDNNHINRAKVHQ